MKRVISFHPYLYFLKSITPYNKNIIPYKNSNFSRRRTSKGNSGPSPPYFLFAFYSKSAQIKYTIGRRREIHFERFSRQVEGKLECSVWMTLESNTDANQMGKLWDNWIIKWYILGAWKYKMELNETSFRWKLISELYDFNLATFVRKRYFSIELFDLILMVEIR